MNSKITGVILAGGKSSRMGRDKAFIRFSEGPMIEILINKLSSLFEDLLIITNKPHAYRKYGIKTANDAISGCGPLGGILSALLLSKNKYNFIFACDMPFLNKNLIRYMIGRMKDYDAVIP